MIELTIKTNGKKVLDHLNIDNPSLKECALVCYRLDQMKEELLAREFESEFEVREGEDES